MAEFNTEPREGCKHVDDQSTLVTSVVVTVVRIWSCLDGTIDADRMCDPVVFSPGMGFPHVRTGNRITEGTAGEGLLHYASSSLVSQAAVQPR